MMIRKSYFTLLELLIVLFIVSFGIVLTGVKIKDIYQEQRFLSESQQVLSHLAMAQDLMLIMDTDVHVKFAPDKKERKQTRLWLEIEKPIKKGWSRLVEREIVLSAIQSLEFEGKSDRELTLQFSLGQMSKGKLVLSEGEQGKSKSSKPREFEIELVGYPNPMGVKRKAMDEDRKVGRSEALYPNEVYEKLYGDPNEKDSSS
jgi:type II secretory pathway pseudopilin PulG